MEFIVGPLAVRRYGSAFLPSTYQATRIGSQGQPIASARLGALTNPRWDEAGQRRQLDLLGDGSVRFIKDSVNGVAWRSLGTIADGEVNSSDSY